MSAFKDDFDAAFERVIAFTSKEQKKFSGEERDLNSVHPDEGGNTERREQEPFTLDERGVWFHGVDKKGEPLPPEWICSPLRVAARTRNTQSSNWGYLLEWEDPDHYPHVWAMAAELASGSGEEYRKALLDGGLQIAPGNATRNHLTTYIMTARTKSRAFCTDRTGWHNGLFVLPHKTLGHAQDRVIFQSAAGATNLFRERGTLADWRDSIGKLCRGNSRLVLACSIGFASVLLELTGDENGGFHLVGQLHRQDHGAARSAFPVRRAEVPATLAGH